MSRSASKPPCEFRQNLARLLGGGNQDEAVQLAENVLASPDAQLIGQELRRLHSEQRRSRKAEALPASLLPPLP